MRKKMRRLILVLAIGIIFFFIIFLVNQTVQIINFCHSLHPLFGKIVKYLLILIYGLLIFFSLYHFIRLPKPLKLPEGKDSKDYKAFLLKIRNRLIKNKNLTAHPVQDRLRSKELDANFQALEQVIREAEKELDKQANQEIKTTAQSIFVSTAISQSGSLDSIVVLMGQARMVWRIAGIYNQRPALREMVKLYANVAATSFAAKAIEDIDFAEIVEPVISSFSGIALINIIPLISILTNSIFSGTANALLTLRTGIVTRKYCSLFSQFEHKKEYRDETQFKKYVRVSAVREAGKLLGGVVAAPSKQVFNVLLRTLKKTKDIPGKLLDEMAKVSKDIINRVVDVFKKKSIEEETEPAVETNG